MTIIHESVDILHYEDGAPYIHDILTNNTDRTIVETQYCMLAYSENGSPLKLYWNFLDTSPECGFENIVRTKTDILPNQTEEYRGGWSLCHNNRNITAANHDVFSFLFCRHVSVKVFQYLPHIFSIYLIVILQPVSRMLT